MAFHARQEALGVADEEEEVSAEEWRRRLVALDVPDVNTGLGKDTIQQQFEVYTIFTSNVY